MYSSDGTYSQDPQGSKSPGKSSGGRMSDFSPYRYKKQRGSPSPELTASYREIGPYDLWFQWDPPIFERVISPLTYRLLVYRQKKHQPFSRAVKDQPVYIADNLVTPFHKYPGQTGVLERGMTYAWEVEARSQDNRLIDTSFTQGFRLVPDIGCCTGGSDKRSCDVTIPGSSGNDQALEPVLYIVPSIFTTRTHSWDYHRGDCLEQLLVLVSFGNGTTKSPDAKETQDRTWAGSRVVVDC